MSGTVTFNTHFHFHFTLYSSPFLHTRASSRGKTWKATTEAHLFHSVTAIFQPCQDCTCYPFFFWSHTFSALRIMLCMHKWWNGQHTFSLLFETTRVFLVTRNSNLNLTVWDVNQLQSFKNTGWNKRTEMECGNNTRTFCLIWYKWNVETNFKMCNRL